MTVDFETKTMKNNHYKRFPKEFCTQKMKANKTMRGQPVPNYRRRKDKESESNINSASCYQTLFFFFYYSHVHTRLVSNP
jgi:hypothetical protein